MANVPEVQAPPDQTPTEAEKIAQAITDGYPDVDEACPAEGCGAIFKNYHHFIRCARRPCPLSTGKTLFDHWREMDSEVAAHD